MAIISEPLELFLHLVLIFEDNNVSYVDNIVFTYFSSPSGIHTKIRLPSTAIIILYSYVINLLEFYIFHFAQQNLKFMQFVIVGRPPTTLVVLWKTCFLGDGKIYATEMFNLKY